MRDVDVTEEDFTRMLAARGRPRNIDRMIAITRARLGGRSYRAIGEEYGIGGARASHIVAKVELLARECRKLDVIGELTKHDSVRFMELTSRSAECLRRLGIDTIGQLVDCLQAGGEIRDHMGQRRSFYSQSNFGLTSQKEVIGWLVDKGFIHVEDLIARQFWPQHIPPRGGRVIEISASDPRFDPAMPVLINGHLFRPCVGGM
jgi:Bacterial RNA polymerase, alpha chain C terminal domain